MQGPATSAPGAMRVAVIDGPVRHLAGRRVAHRLVCGSAPGQAHRPPAATGSTVLGHRRHRDGEAQDLDIAARAPGGRRSACIRRRRPRGSRPRRPRVSVARRQRHGDLVPLADIAHVGDAVSPRSARRRRPCATTAAASAAMPASSAFTAATSKLAKRWYRLLHHLIGRPARAGSRWRCRRRRRSAPARRFTPIFSATR